MMPLECDALSNSRVWYLWNPLIASSMLGKKDFAIICPVEVAVSIVEESFHDLKKKHEIVRDTSMFSNWSCFILTKFHW